MTTTLPLNPIVHEERQIAEAALVQRLEQARFVPVDLPGERFAIQHCLDRVTVEDRETGQSTWFRYGDANEWKGEVEKWIRKRTRRAA